MIENQRHRFRIPDDVTYLNCASEMPLPRDAVAAGEIGLARKVEPWGSGRAVQPYQLADGRGQAGAVAAKCMASPAAI